MQKIAIFGSAFNPPTLGHLDVLKQVISNFEQIWLIPNFQHAFKKKMAPFHHRVAMAQILCNEAPQTKANIIVNTIEEMLFKQNPGPIYTYDVLTALQKKYNLDFEFTFILGPDNAKPAIWQKFYRYKDIEQQWPLWFAKERLAIHSADARNIIQKFHHAPEQCKNQLLSILTKNVIDYIFKNKLYFKNN